MAFRNKTIITKKNGSIFIPNKIIKREYPVNDSHDENIKVYYAKFDLTDLKNLVQYKIGLISKIKFSENPAYCGIVLYNGKNYPLTIFKQEYTTAFKDYCYIKLKNRQNKIYFGQLCSIERNEPASASYYAWNSIEVYSNSKNAIKNVIDCFDLRIEEIKYETNIN